MKREFSFYEFVGIIVPSVILLFFLNSIIGEVFGKSIVDFSKVGDTTIFLIISYGFGHLVHSLGNVFEKVLWWLRGGMPTRWITASSRKKGSLLHESDEEKVRQKLFAKFGEADKDYGRLVYNLLYQKDKTGRIDIFNGNYSLFRSLTISFLLLALLSWYFLTFQLSLVALGLSVLAFIRMLRFAKLYAVELYITFLNLTEG